MIASIDSVEYFSQRAPRYQAALNGCPTARALDTLPYLAILSIIMPHLKSRGIACDAFGGTGFLSRGLSEFSLDFTAVDSCSEMLVGAKNLPRVETLVNRDDFSSILSRYGSNSFDFVFCHGGLHHVIAGSSAGIPDHEASRNRQADIVRRLAELVRVGGILIIADIPRICPSEFPGELSDERISGEVLASCFSPNVLGFLAKNLGLCPDDMWSLSEARQRIKSVLWQDVSFPVPRKFFDDFVAEKSLMGHTAVYPDFDRLDHVIQLAGLQAIWRGNYPTPWVFENQREAGWFFREKFSFFEASPLGVDVASEDAVFKNVTYYLGTKALATCVSVNWGITYAMYRRAQK